MHFETYVLGTGKCAFIAGRCPRDTAGFVKPGSYANLTSAAQEVASQLYSPREALSEDICADSPPLPGAFCGNFV